MSRKFSDFTNSNLEEFANQNQNILNSFKQQNQQTYNDINGLINNYSSLNQNQLFNEFVRTIEQQKKNGTLNIQNFINMKNSIYPMLTPEQKQVFDNLMNYVR